MEILGNDKHKIFYADALEALKTLPDNSVDLIFADPPYNIGKNFNGKIEKWETEAGLVHPGVLTASVLNRTHN